MLFYPQQHSEEMEEYLNQVNQRRKYFQEIATEESAVRKVRTQEVGSVGVSIIHSLSGLLLFFSEVVEKAVSYTHLTLPTNREV